MEIRMALGYVLGRLYSSVENDGLFWDLVHYLTGLWAFGIGSRLVYQLTKGGSFTVLGYLWLDWVPLTLLGVLTAVGGLSNIINRFVLGGVNRD